MTAAEFRRLALELPEAVASSAEALRPALLAAWRNVVPKKVAKEHLGE